MHKLKMVNISFKVFKCLFCLNLNNRMKEAIKTFTFKKVRSEKFALISIFL